MLGKIDTILGYTFFGATIIMFVGTVIYSVANRILTKRKKRKDV